MISILRRRHFTTKRNVNVIEFKAGDLTSLTSFKGDVYPVVIIENSVANEQNLTALISSSGRITYSASNFLRFWHAGFIEDARMMESKDRLQGKLKGFSRDVNGILEREREKLFEATMALLSKNGHLYEEDLYIGAGMKKDIEGKFAVHKFLFESNENWIKDGQWSINKSLSELSTEGAVCNSTTEETVCNASTVYSVSTGPYIMRPQWQRELIIESREVLKQHINDVEALKRKIPECLKSKKLIKIENRSEEVIMKCLKAYADEFYINVQNTPSSVNPFKEIVQEALLGVAIVDSQAQARQLLEKLVGSDLLQFDASRPILNSFVSERKEFKEPVIIKEVTNHTLDTCDFGMMPVYLIDPEGTVEVDDGISVEPSTKENCVILHVHVADPSDLVAGNLEEEAKRRAGTLYLPEIKIPMLPERITTATTLKESGVMTLTFSCKVNLENGEISEQKIQRGIIRNMKHLTYEQAEVTETSDLALLRKVKDAHLKYRESHGHLDFSFPRGIAHVDKINKRINVQVDRGEIGMKRVVAEAMIIAGRIAGESLRDRGICAPFRIHSGCIDNRVFYNSDCSLLLKYEWLKGMPAASVSSTPHPHKSMGLEAYVKVTSPLRRFLDLITHKIIKRNNSVYDADWFKDNLRALRRQEVYNKKVSMAVNRYWIERFLFQEQSNCAVTWTLTVLEKVKDGLWTVHIDEVASNFVVQIKSKNRMLELGERIKGRLVSGPSESIMKFEHI